MNEKYKLKQGHFTLLMVSCSLCNYTYSNASSLSCSLALGAVGSGTFTVLGQALLIRNSQSTGLRSQVGATHRLFIFHPLGKCSSAQAVY